MIRHSPVERVRMSFFSRFSARFSLTLFCAFFFTFFAPLSFACATAVSFARPAEPTVPGLARPFVAVD
jgi:hypothetical protein